MIAFDEHLKVVLDGYSNFLSSRELSDPQHHPYLVRWVRDFLLFAHIHSGYSFEQTLDYFLKDIGERAVIKPWQIRQATVL
jgi:hypothetical protein